MIRRGGALLLFALSFCGCATLEEWFGIADERGPLPPGALTIPGGHTKAGEVALTDVLQRLRADLGQSSAADAGTPAQVDGGRVQAADAGTALLSDAGLGGLEKGQGSPVDDVKPLVQCFLRPESYNVRVGYDVVVRRYKVLVVPISERCIQGNSRVVDLGGYYEIDPVTFEILLYRP